MFYFLGEKLGIADFKNIREWAERDAKLKCSQKYDHMEGALDIWENLAEDVGCSKEDGTI